MTISPRSLALPVRSLAIAAIASSAIFGAGCGGDNPSSMAGSIEAPERKVSGPPTAKSFAKDQATPKAPDR